MNTRRVGGLSAVTAATMLSLFPASAEADTGELCGPVFLERETSVSQELTDAIGAMAARGYDVHVHGLVGAEVHNMQTDEGFDKHLDEVDAQCRWTNRDILVTYLKYVGGENSKYDVDNGILDVNAADDARNSWLTDDDVRNVRRTTGAALNDTSTAVQHDLAVGVLAIAAEYDEYHAPGSKGGDGSYDGPALPAIDVDIPWGGLSKYGLPLIALGGVGGFGAVSVRRRAELGRVRAGLLDGVNTSVEGLRKVRDGASIIASMTSVDDAGMESMHAEAADLARLALEYDRVKQVIGEAKISKLWPNPLLFEEVAQAITRLDTQYVSEVAEYEAARKAVEDDLMQAADRTKRLEELLNQAYSAKGTLAEDGWDVTVLEERYKDLFAQVGTLKERMRTEVVDASDDAEHMIPDIAKYVADTSAVAIAARHSEAITAHDVRAETLELVDTEIIDATTVFDAMSGKTSAQEAYDGSCYADITDIPETVARLRQQLEGIQAQALAVKDKKSITALEAAEKYRDDFTRVLLELRQNTQAIHDRLALLKKLEISLPSDARALHSRLDDHVSDARNWGTDIDQATLESLEATAEGVEDVKIDLASTKPRYLEIRTKLANATNAVDEAYETVTEQRAAANVLRSSIAAEHREAAESLQALQRYLQQNRGDIHGITSEVSIPAVGATGDRQQLQAELDGLQDVDDTIDARLRSAKEQVRQAEAAREAERLRAEARHRASMAAASSSSSRSSSRGSVGGRSSSRGRV